MRFVRMSLEHARPESLKRIQFDKKFLQRLSEKVMHDRLVLQPFRKNRFEMIQECAGHRYGDNGARRQVKLNLMALYQSTVSRSLIAKSPRCYLSTFDPGSRSTVAAMEKWANREIERQRLADVFQRIVIDAFYGPGIAKISLATPADSATSAWNQRAGTARIQRVDLDDFVFDTNARDMSEVEYVGHRFRVPIRVAKSMYKRMASRLQEMSQPDFNYEGDERIGMLTNSSLGFKELEDHVELWEIYLPRHRAVVCLSSDAVNQSSFETGKSLWTQPWIGRETGPYEILSLGTVPGQSMPKAPMMDLFDIHLDCNNAKRKANESLRDVKELTGYRRANDSDAKAVQNSRHLDMVALEDPLSIKPFVTGGKVAQMLQAAALQYKSDFSFIGANLELLGGRSQQGGTLGQEELLQQNASASIADLQDKVTAFVEQCLKSFLWYGWNDPEAVHRSPASPPGLPEFVEMQKIYPRYYQGSGMKRDIPFEELELKVVPYSMRAQTPTQMMSFLNGVVDKMIPMMPLLMQQGILFDAQFWLQELGKLGDAPDLSQIFTVGQPMEPGASPSMSPSAPGEESAPRRAVSERTQGGTDSQLIAAGMDLDLGGSDEES